MTPGPEDPMTPLIRSAAAMHEMVTAYEQVGFTRQESIQIVIAVLTSIMRGQQQAGE